MLNTSTLKVKFLNVDTLNEEGKDIVLIAEPNYNKNHKLLGLKSNLYSVINGADLAMCYKEHLKIDLLYNSNCMIISKIADVFLIACYWSPNVTNEEISQKIDELEQYIFKNKINKQKLILLGDFNSRSSLYEKLYNISYNKIRGQIFEEFI